MTLFTRVEARDFDVLFTRCVSGRPRGPAPPLVVTFTGGVRTLAATTAAGVLLTLTTPAAGEPDDVIVLPSGVLAEVGGGTDESVTLDRQSRLRGVVRWPAGGKPQSLPVELILPGKQHTLPVPPPPVPVSVAFVQAMHECGRTAARTSGRYALSMVQIQGQRGRVVGTDGKVALLWSGFTFPFAADVLVPALPVFATKPLARSDALRVGKTGTHLVVSAGPWAVWLPIEPKGRYPDVAAVVPLQSPTVVAIDPADATTLLRVLSSLPGGNDEHRPVTIDADRVVRVRGRDLATGEIADVTLTRSRTEGPGAVTAVDRRVLARALTLGCRTLRLTPDKPVVVTSSDITLVAAGLDPALVVPGDAAGSPTTPAKTVAVNEKTDIPNPQRRIDVRAKPPETNGHATPRSDPPDPLVVAESLRDALSDAATKAARLVALLRAGRKEKKVLAGVFAGLKQLNLDAPNGHP